MLYEFFVSSLRSNTCRFTISVKALNDYGNYDWKYVEI
jgi:hypothetical protein